MNAQRIAVAAVAASAMFLWPAAAQPALGPNYRLAGYVLSGAGGGGATSASAGYGTAATFGSRTPPTSFSFRASAGFVAAAQPLSGTTPVLFGVDPPTGPNAGGTTLLLTGLGFLRLAMPLTVRVNGVFATNVQRVSDLAVTCTVPAGGYGPVPVTLTDGATTLEATFVYVPGLAVAPFAPLGTELRFACHGAVGTHFVVYASLAPALIELPPYGTLLIHPASLFIAGQGSFAMPSGLSLVRLPVPRDPPLAGLVLYFQMLSIDVAAVPFVIRLTNRGVAQLL